MTVSNKCIYLNEGQASAVDRFTWQERNFEPETREYRGRSYQLHQVFERPLHSSERVKAGLTALIAIVASFGTALFSSFIRDLCLKAINGNETEKYWSPVKKPILEPKPVSIPKPTPTATRLNFDDINLEEGFSVSARSESEKHILSELVKLWNKRIEPKKQDWSLPELSSLLKQEEKTLKKLLDSVYIVPNAEKSYSTFGLERLFHTLNSNLSNAQRASFQPGVKTLWSGSAGEANRMFGKASDKEFWTLNDLGRFLAVSQDALIKFLRSEKEQYSYQEINTAIKRASNGQINTSLEGSRTQDGSIRWGMIAS